MPMCIEASELMRSIVKSFIRVCRAKVEQEECTSTDWRGGSVVGISIPIAIKVGCVVKIVDAEEVW